MSYTAGDDSVGVFEVTLRTDGPGEETTPRSPHTPNFSPAFASHLQEWNAFLAAQRQQQHTCASCVNSNPHGDATAGPNMEGGDGSDLVSTADAWAVLGEDDAVWSSTGIATRSDESRGGDVGVESGGGREGRSPLAWQLCASYRSDRYVQPPLQQQPYFFVGDAVGGDGHDEGRESTRRGVHAPLSLSYPSYRECRRPLASCGCHGRSPASPHGDNSSSDQSSRRSEGEGRRALLKLLLSVGYMSLPDGGNQLPDDGSSSDEGERAPSKARLPSALRAPSHRPPAGAQRWGIHDPFHLNGNAACSGNGHPKSRKVAAREGRTGRERPSREELSQLTASREQCPILLNAHLLLSEYFQLDAGVALPPAASSYSSFSSSSLSAAGVAGAGPCSAFEVKNGYFEIRARRQNGPLQAGGVHRAHARSESLADSAPSPNCRHWCDGVRNLSGGCSAMTQDGQDDNLTACSLLVCGDSERWLDESAMDTARQNEGAWELYAPPGACCCTDCSLSRRPSGRCSRHHPPGRYARHAMWRELGLEAIDSEGGMWGGSTGSSFPCAPSRDSRRVFYSGDASTNSAAALATFEDEGPATTTTPFPLRAVSPGPLPARTGDNDNDNSTNEDTNDRRRQSVAAAGAVLSRGPLAGNAGIYRVQRQNCFGKQLIHSSHYSDYAFEELFDRSGGELRRAVSLAAAAHFDRNNSKGSDSNAPRPRPSLGRSLVPLPAEIPPFILVDSSPSSNGCRAPLTRTPPSSFAGV